MLQSALHSSRDCLKGRYAHPYMLWSASLLGSAAGFRQRERQGQVRTGQTLFLPSGLPKFVPSTLVSDAAQNEIALRGEQMRSALDRAACSLGET